MPAGLTNPERWRLRAEEYRAIAASMNDPTSSEMIERLAATYDRMAAASETRLRAATADLCRARASECVAFAKRLTTEASRSAVHAVARRWLDTARCQNTGLEFVVTVEHRCTRRRIQLIVDNEFRLLSCPDGFDPERLQALVRGQEDPDGEYRFVCRERRAETRLPGPVRSKD